MNNNTPISNIIVNENHINNSINNNTNNTQLINITNDKINDNNSTNCNNLNNFKSNNQIQQLPIIQSIVPDFSQVLMPNIHSIKSHFILSKILTYVPKYIKYKLFQYNKRLQQEFAINLDQYKHQNQTMYITCKLQNLSQDTLDSPPCFKMYYCNECVKCKSKIIHEDSLKYFKFNEINTFESRNLSSITNVLIPKNKWFKLIEIYTNCINIQNSFNEIEIDLLKISCFRLECQKSFLDVNIYRKLELLIDDTAQLIDSFRVKNEIPNIYTSLYDIQPLQIHAIHTFIAIDKKEKINVKSLCTKKIPNDTNILQYTDYPNQKYHYEHYQNSNGFLISITKKKHNRQNLHLKSY
jgi:hypothetical protein